MSNLTLIIILILVSVVFGLAASSRQEAFKSRKVTQIGLVVSDIEKSAKSYADLFGVPVPEITITDPLEKANIVYRGNPTKARAKLAFFHLDNISIELIQPIGEPSTWQEALDKNGSGVHHIAFQVDDMQKNLDFFTSKDSPLIQRGDFTGGSYAYVDTEKQLSVIVELLSSTD